MKKEAFFRRQTRRWKEEERRWCRKYVKEYWLKETGQILRIADEVSRNTFLFDLPWDMERTFEPVTYPGKVSWEEIPFSDPEFVYQLNRHRYFICLGQAYLLTGEETYAETFVRLLTDWIRRENLTPERKNTTWRTIEAGIRGETWTKSILYFEESPALTEEVLELFEESLRVHGEYLLGAYTPFKLSSNWGVLENNGLYLIGSALGEEKFRKAALQRLEEEAGIQLMADGVHWEQSPMYHNEVLHCFLETAAQIHSEKRELPKFLQNAVRNMALADLAWKKPNHCQAAAGDSDETDVRDQLTRSAFLLKDGLLKSGGYGRLDFESAWDFRSKGQEEYAALEAKLPGWTDRMLPHSGNYYLRSDWGEDADFLHFRLGPLGGGHGHFDKLHVDLVLNGEDILVDAGRYQYVFHEKRRELKSARGHNTLLVDNKEYMECIGSWAVQNSTPEIRQAVYEDGRYCMVQGGHFGYLQKGIDAYCHRKVLRLQNGLYLLADIFYSGGTHRFSSMFHFAPERNVTVHGIRADISGKKGTASFFFLGRDVGIEKEESICSRYYNEYRQNEALCVTVKGSGVCTLYTVIGKGGEALAAKKIPVFSIVQGRELMESEAEGLRIRKGADEYTVLFRHKDLAEPCGLIGSGKKRGLGKTMVFHGEEEGTVLEW